MSGQEKHGFECRASTSSMRSQAYSHRCIACPAGPCWAGADLLHGAPRREAHVALAIPAVVAELVDALA
jgi:hypothetical protein